MTISPEEARAIAKEAYLYGWPMSENYNTLFAYTLDVNGPNFKAPFNEIKNEPKVFGPDDTTVVTPNSDTPYSFIWGDIRAEPLVITVPPMDTDPSSGETRYFSFQLIDLYTFNFDYIGTRSGHDQGGSFLIAGPRWNAPTPEGITAVLRCETEFFFSVTRTQLFSPDDISNVEAIQNQYKVETLSEFLGAGSIEPPEPEWPERCAEPRTPAVFTVINFMLQYCPTVPQEEELMSQFAKIGVGPGLPFDSDALSDEMSTALQAGIDDAWTQFDELNDRVGTGQVGTESFFGSRAEFEAQSYPPGDNMYLYRFAGAKIGLYGNSKEEARYIIYYTDAAGAQLDASTNRYVIVLDEALPAKAFASFTMYDLETQLLVRNPIERYLINTPMANDLVTEDGKITLYLQNQSPGSALEANWLPAPAATFYVVLRLYIPEDRALDGSWTEPPIQLAQG